MKGILIKKQIKLDGWGFVAPNIVQYRIEKAIGSILIKLDPSSKANVELSIEGTTTTIVKTDFSDYLWKIPENVVIDADLTIKAISGVDTIAIINILYIKAN